MATYLLFGKYSSEALKGISAKRSEDAKALFKKHGGGLKAAYATLGGIDLVMIADLPDNARAMAASAALAKATGIGFTTAPAVTVGGVGKRGGRGETAGHRIHPRAGGDGRRVRQARGLSRAAGIIHAAFARFAKRGNSAM